MTDNYLLNREVNTLELVRGTGGEGGEGQIPRWENPPMPLVTDLEDGARIGCEVLRFRSVMGVSGFGRLSHRMVVENSCNFHL